MIILILFIIMSQLLIAQYASTHEGKDPKIWEILIVCILFPGVALFLLIEALKEENEF